MGPVVSWLIAAVLAAALGGCKSPAPPVASTDFGIAKELAEPDGLDHTALGAAIAQIAARVAPGVLGVAVKDLDSGETWTWNGERAFPLQSVFKAPLGAAVLAEVDAGRLSLAEMVRVGEADLSPPYSLVSAAWPERADYSIEELLVLAAGGSDNTAADILMARVGGPAALTAWLRTHGVEGMRIDRYEREFQTAMAGLGPFRPEWRTQEALEAAIEKVPVDARRQALTAYLADPRDTSSPVAAAAWLERLAAGELLSPNSTEQLLRILTETTTGARRIRAALPADATLAHKTGSARPDMGMSPVVNDIGLITLAGGRRVIVAVFLAGAPLAYQQAEDVHAEVARVLLAALR